MFFAAKLQKYFELCKYNQEKMLNFGNSHNFRSKIATIFGKVQKTPLLMVVGFTAEDGHGAVELFNEQQPDHLMAESHLAEGDLGIRALIHRLTESVRPADDER